jgi:hypothetical protein
LELFLVDAKLILICSKICNAGFIISLTSITSSNVYCYFEQLFPHCK